MKSLNAPVIFLGSVALMTLMATIVLIGTQPETIPESKLYLDFPMDGLLGIFQQGVPMGYPIFLKLVGLISPDLEYLPQAQAAAFIAAVLFLFRALIRYGFDRWSAVVAVIPLLCNRTLWGFGTRVGADLLALSAAIVCVGSVFLVLAARGNPGPGRWSMLAVTVFGAYMLRGDYLFLIPLVPCLLPLLESLRPASSLPSMPLKRLFVTATIACLLPFLAYCSVRYCYVKHFGLTTMGEQVMVITAIQFLEERDVQHLDKDLLPFARAVLLRRKPLDAEFPKDGKMYSMTIWPEISYVYDKRVACPAQLDVLGVEGEHDAVYIQELPRAELKELAEMLKKFSVAMFMLHPRTHIEYYLKSTLYGISFALYVDGAIITPLLLLFFATYLILAVRRNRPLDHDQYLVSPAPGSCRIIQWSPLSTLVLVAVSFFLAKLLLNVLLVSVQGRYLTASSVFIPSMLAFAVYENCSSIFRERLCHDPSR